MSDRKRDEMGEETRDRIGDGGEDRERSRERRRSKSSRFRSLRSPASYSDRRRDSRSSRYLSPSPPRRREAGLNPGAGDIGLDLCPDAGKGLIYTPDSGLGRGVTDIDGTTLGLDQGAQRVTRTDGETAGAADTSHPHRQEEEKLAYEQW